MRHGTESMAANRVMKFHCSNYFDWSDQPSVHLRSKPGQNRRTDGMIGPLDGKYPISKFNIQLSHSGVWMSSLVECGCVWSARPFRPNKTSWTLQRLFFTKPLPPPPIPAKHSGGRRHSVWTRPSHTKYYELGDNYLRNWFVFPLPIRILGGHQNSGWMCFHNKGQGWSLLCRAQPKTNRNTQLPFLFWLQYFAHHVFIYFILLFFLCQTRETAQKFVPEQKVEIDLRHVFRLFTQKKTNIVKTAVNNFCVQEVHLQFTLSKIRLPCSAWVTLKCTKTSAYCLYTFFWSRPYTWHTRSVLLWACTLSIHFSEATSVCSHNQKGLPVESKCHFIPKI